MTKPKEKIQMTKATEPHNNGNNGNDGFPDEHYEELKKLSPAEKFLFEVDDEKIIERSRLSRKMIVLFANQIMQEAIPQTRRNVPLSQVWRVAYLRGMLSLEGESRKEGVATLQVQAEEQAQQDALKD